jgi:hypothetical protein
MKADNHSYGPKLSTLRSQEWYTGFFELQKNAASGTKLALPFSADPDSMKVVEVKKLAEKLKWMEFFRCSYDTALNKLPNRYYKSDISRFFKIVQEEKELGFIRITKGTPIHGGFVDTWNISEIFTKKPYRHMGVATALIHHMMSNYQVNSITISIDRYVKNKCYFSNFGFNYVYKVDEDLLLCFNYDIENLMHRNKGLNSSIKSAQLN